METPNAVVKFGIKAILNAVGGGFAGDLAVEVLPEVLRDVARWWKHHDAPEPPSNHPQTVPLRQARNEIAEQLGVEISGRARATEVARANAKLKGGLVIDTVLPNSPAAHAGVRRNDILVGLGGENKQWYTLTLGHLLWITREGMKSSQSEPLKFIVVRGKQWGYLSSRNRSALRRVH